MRFDVTVTVEDGDSFLYTADAAAQQVIAALGGNPANDYCSVIINQNSHGAAGNPPPVTPPGQ